MQRQARRSAQPLLHLRRDRAPGDARRRRRGRAAGGARGRAGGQGGQRMRLAFVVDPLPELKAYKDSSVAMMREAARRGHAVHAFEARSMYVHGGTVRCRALPISLTDDDDDWYAPAGPVLEARVADFDRVFMRKDPPFDQEYYYATLLLERAGTTVVNDPRALRDWNEKLAILRFPAFSPPTLVAAGMDRIQAFIDEHRDVIV